jgi:hypothetical protein
MVAGYDVKGESLQLDQPRVWNNRRLGVAGGFPSFDIAPGSAGLVGIFEGEESSAENTLRVVLNVGDEIRRRLSH